MFTRETVKHLCQMMARYRVFVFVSFLFLSSIIRVFSRNVRIQHKDHNRPTLEVDHCLFTLQDEIIYHQVIPSFWE